jgi:hypothetical protein
MYKDGAVPGYEAQISLYQTEGIEFPVAYNLTRQIFHAGSICQSSVIIAINNAIINGEAARGRQDGAARLASVV